YPGVPEISAFANGTYTAGPQWYRNFLYTEERARGLDDLEDLASPGVLAWDLAASPAVCLLGSGPAGAATLAAHATADACFSGLRAAEEKRRNAFAGRLHRAADAYLVRRGRGRTIIAGYPWFTDWGRDSFIALPGLCLALDRLDDAQAILREWAGTVSEG